MPRTHLPWHDEPQLHSTKATAVHDHFQQHFTTFTSIIAAGHAAEYPSGATGWRVEEADIVYVILQGSSQSLCWLFPRMSASRMRVPNLVGSAQPATSVAGPFFAGRSGHDGGTFAATPRRTAALRPPEPPTEPPPTKLRPPSAAFASASAVAVVSAAAVERSIPAEQLGGGLKKRMSSTQFCKGLHGPFVKHLAACPVSRLVCS